MRWNAVVLGLALLFCDLSAGDAALTVVLDDCGAEGLLSFHRVQHGYAQRLVQGLVRQPEKVSAIRRSLADKKKLGPVNAIRWDGRRLPYADNMVNVLVAPAHADVSRAEVMRVLAPGGMYVAGNTTHKKKWPGDIDTWTHFLHDTDNNAVARDTRIAPSRYMQWVAGPKWGRSHDHLAGISAAVSDKGRIFYIADEGPVASVKSPSVWRLVARDAFNGVLLWKKDISPWENQLRPFRSGPAELPRRLVAVGDRVYVTLGYGKPVTALDAATGEVVQTFEGTDNTHEIMVYRGKLYLVISDPLPARSAATGTGVVGKRFPAWRGGYAEYNITYRPKHVRVLKAETGDLVWEKTGRDVRNILPLTMTISGGRMFFQNETHLIALDAGGGRELWRTKRPAIKHRYAWLTPTVVAADGVVLSADRLPNQPVAVDAGNPISEGGRQPADAAAAFKWRVSSNHELFPGEIRAYAADTGKPLWTVPAHEGFNAPVDVLVADGKVWSGVLAWKRQPGFTQVIDLHTGRVAEERSPDQEVYSIGFGHARCYRHKATTRYVLSGRSGIEFVDMQADRVIAEHWVRGACQYGILPCNGLVYAPSHSCACYITAKLSGFNALSGVRETPFPKTIKPVLEKGPAYAMAQEAIRQAGKSADPAWPDAWPTLRHDGARNGTTRNALPAALSPRWTRSLAGPLSAVTAADGRLYVAQVETNTVHAMNADDGRSLWSFASGGRVDSPPTVYGGLVYFGSADGWLYCVHARDGQLAWRFQVAPEARQIVSYGRLESAWPVHGSVLVCRDGDAANQVPVVYAAAGRTSYIDGGVFLCAVNGETGKLIFRRRISHRDPETGEEPQATIKGVTMPGAMPDVMATDGAAIFMRHQRFDREGNTLHQTVNHLYSAAGFLDDMWWHRTYLQIGRTMSGGYGGWTQAGMRHVSGRALVRAGKLAYGFGRKNYAVTGSHVGLQGNYHLFAAHAEPVMGINKKGKKTRPTVKYLWSKPIPFYPRAMTLAGGTLWLAGCERVEDFDAAEPEKGIWLWAVSAKDGTKLWSQSLKAAPVYDSFAVSGGALYFTSVDGRVMCWR